MKLDLTVPPLIRSWEAQHLPVLRRKRFTDEESERRRDAGRRFCNILDELAQPLGEAAAGASWSTAVRNRKGAQRLLDTAAQQHLDHQVARMTALLTVAACSTLPGLIWRNGARFEHFTLRPSNDGPDGACVVKPWDVAKAACGGKETGGLGYFILAQEADAAIRRYFGGKRWSAALLEQEHLEPHWPSQLT